ncbi:bifunctional proline dehydrogenase/L-glutamate gamma-semialdehyde dehydrogenase [Piscicoccus intestinalis]|uniref:bifunctional proline dehydrogenase/L-glutamate gamma-semialdehyde dehydrogenase n=1 Tax=Piscicoccus intestinalis TaxID=746033 RepID=UPI000AD24DEE|nr:bifunctional proline dehydrogenase/L-glutamate gamma-semialdehyde dehydrogenase [Piscicoccus intestinalis]
MTEPREHSDTPFPPPSDNTDAPAFAPSQGRVGEPAAGPLTDGPKAASDPSAGATADPSAGSGGPDTSGTGSAAYAPLVEEAVALAQEWTRATERGQTRSERATTGQLAALVRDEAGLDLGVRFVDRVARPEDSGVAARELSRLTTGDASGFLGGIDRTMLQLGSFVAPLAPPVVVPLARKRLRQIIGHLVVDAEDPALGKHLAKARDDGFRLNVNLLGEAVLGEDEAASRTERVDDLLARPDVDYVSIKVSSLVSQITTWDQEGTVQRCLDRLRPLYRTAKTKSPHAFVNLDMEEYRDLDLTMELFQRLLSEEEFRDLEAGIVLQAYLPDALPAMEELIEFAQKRVEGGGAGIKIRLVKGANLAMEHVESALHGWTPAPYDSKPEVDANYLRCVERALRPELSGVVRLGVASHNLYDVAAAHLLARSRGVTDSLDIEMLQGMAPAQARAVKADVGTVLLYTPVVAPKDFDVAVSYLIRRLEENAQSENFLHAIFSGDAGVAEPDSPAMTDQESRFRASVAAIESTPVGPRRVAGPATIGAEFDNTPDRDPALPDNRAWAAERLAAQPAPLTSPELDRVEQVEEVVARGVAAHEAWAALPASRRAYVLLEAARGLERRRGELVTVAAAEGGKTIEQSDPEVSEAIDFARYYAERAIELEPGASLHTDGARFTPDRLVLITPPWNFPIAIPIGGVLAGLAAGAAVIIKPAPPTPGCVEVVAEAVFEALDTAGLPRDVLQVVRVAENDAGRALVAHDDVDTVVLTGASDTAKLFSGWRAGRPGGARVYGETSGKNSLIVTPAADLDLAVADLVKSAFGHAGQKCSAASLGILVGSVGTSDRFRRQLIDAVRSLRVGWPSDIGVTMGPVIEPPSGKLLRALTTLEPGETWLVEPRQLDDTGRLWSPGLKDNVAPGSFFHLTEVFGPVLGLMRADSLDEAIDLQNATAYGLTGGLHSLDEEEIERWLNRVEVGNAYVNRHITGAIVRRQSFGGWKSSVVGPGAKAGGPNYVALLGHWASDGLPTQLGEPARAARAFLRAVLPLIGDRSERTWLRAAVASDALAWESELGRETDESGLVVEANVFRYRPHPQVWIRTTPSARMAQVLRLVLAGITAGATVRVSLDPATSAELKADGRTEETSAGLRAFAAHVDRAETDEDFLVRVERGDITGRVRLVGENPTLAAALAEEAAGLDITLFTQEVLATGRRELLTMLREQAYSRTMHRFGHLPPAR